MPYDALAENDLPLSGRLTEYIQKIAALSKMSNPSLRVHHPAAPTQPRTIAIFGERGVGKSTVLHFACHVLQRDNFVLPIIDPANFGAGDSLASWVLAQLRRYVDDVVGEAPLEGGSSISRTLIELERSEALSSRPYSSGLAGRGLTPEEYGRDASSVTYRRAEFPALWSKLVGHLLDHESVSLDSLVIPIDDADLRPELLQNLLDDLDILTTSRRVLILFAADEASLRDGLLIANLSGVDNQTRAALNLSLISSESLRDTSHKRFSKYFPRAQRVRLAPAQVYDVLDFKPITYDVTLRELLASVPLSNAPKSGQTSILDYFIVTDQAGRAICDSEFVKCLPQTSRDISDLYMAVLAAGQDSKEAMRAVIEHGLSEPLPEQDGSGHPIVDIIESPDGVAPTGITFNFLGMSTGRTLGAGRPFYLPLTDADGAPAAELYTRLVRENYVRVEKAQRRKNRTESEEDEAPDEGDASTGRMLKSRSAHSIFLAWDCTRYRRSWANQFEFLSYTGDPLTTPGLRSWRDHVSLPRTRVDDSYAYWTVPDWDTWSNYFTFSDTWKRLCDAVVPLNLAPGDTTVLEFLFLAHIDLVVSIHSTGRVPIWLGDVLLADRRAPTYEIVEWANQYEQRRLEVEQNLLKCAVRARQSEDSDMEEPFLLWFTAGLTFMSVEACATPRLTEWIRTLRPRVEMPEALLATASSIVSREINAHIAESRSLPEIQAFYPLDAQRASFLLSVHQALGNTQAAEKTTLLTFLRDRKVPDDLLDRLQTEGGTQEVLSSFAMLNWSGDAIGQIARTFPAGELTAGQKHVPSSVLDRTP